MERERSEGQALVEVALVIPLFFALLFAIIDMGRAIWANDVVANAAREGARYASVNAGTPGVGTFPVTKDEIRARAQEFVIAGGVDTRVTVCFSAVNIASQQPGCSGNVDEAGVNFVRGNLVTVTVESDVPIFYGPLIGSERLTVRGESTVLINN